MTFSELHVVFSSKRSGLCLRVFESLVLSIVKTGSPTAENTAESGGHQSTPAHQGP